MSARAVVTEEITDEHGSYVVFVGKTCHWEGCGVQLTSRNRFENRTLCVEHGKARRRVQRAESTSPMMSVRTPAPELKGLSLPAPLPAAGFPRTPEAGSKANLRSALERFMRFPAEGYSLKVLKAALRDYELTARLRRVISERSEVPKAVCAKGSEGIPIEEPEAPRHP